MNDRDFLLSAAKRAGLPEDQAAALLDDPNAMRAEVAPLAHFVSACMLRRLATLLKLCADCASSIGCAHATRRHVQRFCSCETRRCCCQGMS